MPRLFKASTPEFDASRRSLLRSTLGTAAAVTLPGIALTACGGGDDSTPAATLSGIGFEGMSAPTLAQAAAMATTTVGSTAVATYSDGSTRTTR